MLDGVSVVPGVIDLEAYEELADVVMLVVATLDAESYANRFERRAAGQTRRSAHRKTFSPPQVFLFSRHRIQAS